MLELTGGLVAFEPGCVMPAGWERAMIRPLKLMIRVGRSVVIPSPERMMLTWLTLSVYVGRLVPLSQYALHSRSSNMVSQCS